MPHAQSVGVIYSTFEESLRKTGRARLEAAGAVHFWTPELPRDLDRLFDLIVDQAECASGKQVAEQALPHPRQPSHEGDHPALDPLPHSHSTASRSSTSALITRMLS